MASKNWNVDFLASHESACQRVLIILNQPFSFPLLERVWKSTHWHCCADGGANRLHDLVASLAVKNESLSNGIGKNEIHKNSRFMPDLIKGDLDSLRCDVRHYYASQGVPVVEDSDQYTTDLMKCVTAVEEKEREDGQEYEIIILGGLAGRLDQTVHLLSFLHKLRKKRSKIFAVTDDNVGWVLDEGEHSIRIDHSALGVTCGLLPIGVDGTMLSTSGLRWNLTDHPSSFDGLMSTSNHLVPGQDVWIKTSRPIWWTAELRDLGAPDKKETLMVNGTAR
ncbi:thiamine pyrophosphokinase [Marasmius tenuissimus]|nr:thiamine pyrophosphokinase [Marasmius tenuissimus]